MEWISVKDEYPKSGFWYLVSDGKRVHEMFYPSNNNFEGWRIDDGEFVKDLYIDGRPLLRMKPTHWMPLPPPPTE